ncbi:MAG: cytochrome c [Phycisphaerales bacterium]|nr:cytochrome c [Phycisphaerales bacterium]
MARGMLADDDHLERGFNRNTNNQGGVEIQYFTSFPKQLTIDTRFVQRGQKLYGVYCATCHGMDGYGNGPINQRAIEKEEPKWVPASNLHTEEIRGRADGHLYNTIRNGIRNMPAYGSQIDTADRWAIVAYVRALQRSQHATLEEVPAEERDKMR